MREPSSQAVDYSYRSSTVKQERQGESTEGNFCQSSRWQSCCRTNKKWNKIPFLNTFLPHPTFLNFYLTLAFVFFFFLPSPLKKKQRSSWLGRGEVGAIFLSPLPPPRGRCRHASGGATEAAQPLTARCVGELGGSGIGWGHRHVPLPISAVPGSWGDTFR